MLKDVFLKCNKATKKTIEAQGSQRSDTKIRDEAAILVSLAIIFNSGSDIATYARNVGLSPEALGFDFLGTVRWALLIAALRALEDK
jgi:hypothetical protein